MSSGIESFWSWCCGWSASRPWRLSSSGRSSTSLMSLFWNDQVIRSNEFHTYFRVNSVFWDPNIYGRYLALVAVVAMSALLWARARRDLALLTALVVVLWIGLLPTFSQSSFAALLAGLAVLAALKWSLRWTLACSGRFRRAGRVRCPVRRRHEASLDRINIDTSGRANLVSGGIHLFAQRPVYGYGSGSFPKAYREHVETTQSPRLGLPHRANNSRSRAGLRRPGRLHSSSPDSPVDDGRRPATRCPASVSRAGGAGGGSRTDRSPPAGLPSTTGPARCNP